MIFLSRRRNHHCISCVNLHKKELISAAIVESYNVWSFSKSELRYRFTQSAMLQLLLISCTGYGIQVGLSSRLLCLTVGILLIFLWTKELPGSGCRIDLDKIQGSRLSHCWKAWCNAFQLMFVSIFSIFIFINITLRENAKISNRHGRIGVLSQMTWLHYSQRCLEVHIDTAE